MNVLKSNGEIVLRGRLNNYTVKYITQNTPVSRWKTLSFVHGIFSGLSSDETAFENLLSTFVYHRLI
jgi:hypothetical protein